MDITGVSGQMTICTPDIESEGLPAATERLFTAVPEFPSSGCSETVLCLG